MNKDQMKGSIHKLLKGEANPDQLDELNKWYDEMEVGPSRVSDELAEQKDTIKERMLNRLHREIRTGGSVTKRGGSSVWMGLSRVAAVFVLVSGLSFLAYHWNAIESILTPVEYISYDNTGSERSTHVLPDGSKVWLNANSRFVYSNQFNQKVREVYLEGEAFFDVKRDEKKPFVIQTGRISTTVLGTSFNISAFEEENIRVTVATGRVQVDLRNEVSNGGIVDQEILVPGSQAIYNSKERVLSQRVADLDIDLAWKVDQLVFDEIPLSKAFLMLEKKYQVDIKINDPAVANCEIIGKHEGESLESILQSMQFALGFDYEFQSANLVYITGHGCF